MRGSAPVPARPDQPPGGTRDWFRGRRPDLRRSWGRRRASFAWATSAAAASPGPWPGGVAPPGASRRPFSTMGTSRTGTSAGSIPSWAGALLV